MAESIGADRVLFNCIENWGIYSGDEFEKMSVMADDKIKDEYRKYFTKEVINNPMVDFSIFQMH